MFGRRFVKPPVAIDVYVSNAFRPTRAIRSDSQAQRAWKIALIESNKAQMVGSSTVAIKLQNTNGRSVGPQISKRDETRPDGPGYENSWPFGPHFPYVTNGSFLEDDDLYRHWKIKLAQFIEHDRLGFVLIEVARTCANQRECDRLKSVLMRQTNGILHRLANRTF